MNLIVFDLEWNMGNAPKTFNYHGAELTLRGEIIQIGAARVDENGDVLDTFEMTLRPRIFRKLHWRIAEVTGLSQGDLEAGVPIAEGLRRFQEWAGPDAEFAEWGLDDVPVLSCSVLAARADGHRVTTLEGLQEEAAEFGAFIADQGAEQCGFCNPGFIMNALALFREKPDPNEEEIKEYLAGNLCRCSGYEGQLRGIQNFLAWKKSKEAAQ